MRKLISALMLAAALGFAARASAQHEPAAAHGDAKGEHVETKGEHGEGEEGAAHEGHHAPGAINWFDFGNTKQPPWGAYAINLAILLSAYYYFGKKPVANFLAQRRANVAKEIEEAQRLRKEAEARAAKYQEKLEHLEADLEGAKKALVDAGVAERERIIKEAEEKAARLERDAQFLIEQELKQMRLDLIRETAEAAVTAAEDMLRKRVTQADHERLAEEYLAQLAKPASTEKGASS